MACQAPAILVRPETQSCVEKVAIKDVPTLAGKETEFDDSIIFVGPESGKTIPHYPQALPWSDEERLKVTVALISVLENTYAGPSGFGDIATTLSKFGVSATNPIILLHENGDYQAAAKRPYVYIADAFFAESRTAREFDYTITHELAHLWDEAEGFYVRSEEMRRWVNWGEPATTYGETNRMEDLAEAVVAYFWPEYQVSETAERFWTDDVDGKAWDVYPWANGRADQLRMDKGQEWRRKEKREASETGTIQVQDRYDFLQLQFTGTWLTP